MLDEGDFEETLLSNYSLFQIKDATLEIPDWLVSMMENVYQLVHVNAQLDTVGPHAPYVNRYKIIFENSII